MNVTQSFHSHFQSINEKDDDPSAANPMLYGPLQGAKISRTNQFVATVIRKFMFNCVHSHKGG